MSMATTTGLPLRGVGVSVTEALSACGIKDVRVARRHRHLDLVAHAGKATASARAINRR
jgi:hypothetical protein